MEGRALRPPNITDTRTELAAVVERRGQVAETLTNLERQIYEFEGSYLANSQMAGNIGNVVRGYAQDETNMPGASSCPISRSSASANHEDLEAERLFSRSSSTYMAAVSGPAYINPPAMDLESNHESKDHDGSHLSEDVDTVDESDSSTLSKFKTTGSNDHYRKRAATSAVVVDGSSILGTLDQDSKPPHKIRKIDMDKENSRTRKPGRPRRLGIDE